MDIFTQAKHADIGKTNAKIEQAIRGGDYTKASWYQAAHNLRKAMRDFGIVSTTRKSHSF